MKPLRIIALLCTLTVAATVMASDAGSRQTAEYLGLAIPFPDSIPHLSILDSSAIEFRSRQYELNLTVDSSGIVTDAKCASDSIFPFLHVTDQMRQMRFRFTPGRYFQHSHIVPVSVTVPALFERSDSVSLVFPISQDTLTDSVLIRKYFERNGIQPPAMTYLPPVSYIFKSHDTAARYWTVTMKISLDEAGILRDISYPDPAQTEMSHQVHVGVMNADFEPARLRGEPFASEFLLTFRIFDNINYPFSPFQAPDTSRPLAITTRYFMTRYYNDKDISLFPLPRKHARGYIRGAKFKRFPPGMADVSIAIDETGTMKGIVVTKCSSGLRAPAYEAVRLLSWYPAVTRTGTTTPFEGKIRLEFRGTPEVVYIPEWFSF